MQVAFFGRLADVLATRQLIIDNKAIDSGDTLRAHLSAAYPHAAALLAHKGTRLVVNDAIVDWTARVSAQDDIAIIPVVSGG